MFSIALAVVVVVYIVSTRYFAYKTRQELHRTIRESFSSDAGLSSESISLLIESIHPKNRDLRIGVFCIASALALIVAGIFESQTGDPEIIPRTLAVAAFPILVGVTYIGFHVRSQLGNNGE